MSSVRQEEKGYVVVKLKAQSLLNTSGVSNRLWTQTPFVWMRRSGIEVSKTRVYKDHSRQFINVCPSRFSALVREFYGSHQVSPVRGGPSEGGTCGWTRFSRKGLGHRRTTQRVPRIVETYFHNERNPRSVRDSTELRVPKTE